MYSASQLAAAVRNPAKVPAEVKRKLGRPLYCRYADRIRSRRALDFMEADWDTLVILDACRYDLFAEHGDLPGDLRKVVSKGTGTPEFLDANVGGRSFPAVVYLSANPHLQFQDARFHDVWRLWETDWNDDLGTVEPGAVADRVREAHERYPHKRLVAHFVQPHYPFIGETGRELRDRDVAIRGFLEDHASVFQHLAEGRFDHDEVWRAYRENLELTLPHVRALLDELPGRTVVSSDHGNAFGEWGVYGHGGPPIAELTDVPWLISDNGDRKRIDPGTADTETGATATPGDSEVVRDRLERLGYT